MLKSPLRQRGMSLIEVMVAVTLAALLLSLGVPSFNKGLQNRQIRNAADAIQNGLVVAKNEALRRNRSVLFHLRDGNSWTVGCATPDTAVGADGQQNCPGTLQVREAAEGSTNAQVATAQLSQATGSPVGGTPVFAGDLVFTPLGRIDTGSLPAGNIAEYAVSNPATGTCAAAGGEMRCLSVRVTSFGQVRMCDPAVDPAAVPKDPRAC